MIFAYHSRTKMYQDAKDLASDTIDAVKKTTDEAIDQVH